jgi:Uma2 family endonuclease
MAMTTNLLTWAEFEQLPDDATHREIVEGELITLPPPMFGHSNIARRAYEALRPLEESGLGKVFWAVGCKLSHDPPTWIQPDVSFLWSEHIRATLPDDYFTAAPGLAVEIVCPSESARDLDRKVETLLAAAGQQVWVVYPETHKVHVFLRDRTFRTHRIGDTLSLPDLLPGWELPVARLFEDEVVYT